MSVFQTKKSKPYYWYSFDIDRRRFSGSTRCTTRKEAERFEALERKRAEALIKAQRRSAASLAIDDVVARLWEADAQYDADPAATETNFARLVEYFGKTTLLTDIDHAKASKMVAWRRGQRVTGRKDKAAAPLVSNATVNRSATKVLQRIFNFATSEGTIFDREPKWGELLLDEPVERVRELQDEEADALDDAMRDDLVQFFAFARATGMRLRECVLLRWSEVNFGSKQIVKLGKGNRRVVFPITDAIRELIFPLKGQHDDFVFTYVAIYGNKRLGIVRGERYPLSYNGAKSAWQRMRAKAGVSNFRFHDHRHSFATELLRETGNLKLVQKALNHADIKSTLRYAHVLDEDVAEAVEAVARRKSLGKTLGKLREVG